MYSTETGLVSREFNEILSRLRQNINEELGTNYTETTFLASNWYRIAYILAQDILYSEQSFEAGWEQLKNFLISINYEIAKPMTLTQTIIEKFQNELDLKVNFRQATSSTAGKIFMSIDTTEDNFESKKNDISELLVKCGILNYYFEGSKHWYYNLSNGQKWRFACELPEYVDIWVIIDIIVSKRNIMSLPDADEVKTQFIKNFNEKSSIGQDIEWDWIFGVNDINWAASVNIGYKNDEISTTYFYEPKPLEYNQKGRITEENIVVNFINN